MSFKKRSICNIVKQFLNKKPMYITILLSPLILFGVDIGELHKMEKTDLENMSSNNGLVEFNRKVFDLKDEDSFTEFREEIEAVPNLKDKLEMYFEKDMKELQNFIRSRSTADNLALFRQLDYLFNEKISDPAGISNLTQKLDKLIEERRRMKDEISRIKRKYADKKYLEIFTNVESYLFYCQYQEIFTYLSEKMTDEPELLADLLYLKAGIHFLVFDYQQAESSIVKALEMQPDNVYFLKFYGYLLNELGFAQRSIAINQQVLDLENRNASEPSAANYSSIGASYYKNRQYAKAIENYLKALEISRQNLPENDPNIARNYNDLAQAYDKKKDYRKAIEYYRKAIEIDLKTIGEENVIVARNYNNLGSAFFNLQQYRKAIENFEKAVEIDLKTVGKNDKNTASHYGNLGFAYLKIDDENKAKKNFRNVIKISRKLKIADWVAYFEKKIEEIDREY